MNSDIPEDLLDMIKQLVIYEETQKKNEQQYEYVYVEDTEEIQNQE